MRVGQPLRLYANPVKLVLLLLASAIFVAIGLLMLHDPKASAFIAWAAIVFFGLGVVVFLIMVIRDVVLRRAVLQIDERGWSYRSGSPVGSRTVNWQDIAHVALYRQQMGPGRTMYYLVVHGRDLNKVTRAAHFSARFYPSLQGSLMMLPLNYLFVRTTPKKVKGVLERIRTRYGYELQLYGIQVDAEIHAL
ncbi:MAG TPA: STM3941 family protein [Ktedonobacterales bacterium]|jgi:hypothetical protein